MSEMGLENDCMIRVHTFGKGPGCNGGERIVTDVSETVV